MPKANSILNFANSTFNECVNCYAFRHCTSCIRACINGVSGNQDSKMESCKNTRRSFNEILILRKLVDEIL